jgi:hypothetical protein
VWTSGNRGWALTTDSTAIRTLTDVVLPDDERHSSSQSVSNIAALVGG